MDTIKVKKFVKKHKKELVIGGAGLVIGCVLTKRKLSKDEIAALKVMRSFGYDVNDNFGSMANGIVKASNGSVRTNTIVAREGKKELSNYITVLNKLHEGRDPEVTGMLVFYK